MLKSTVRQRLNGLRSPKPLLSVKMAMVLFLCLITIIQLSRVRDLWRPRSPANTQLGTTGADATIDCPHPSEAGPGCASPSAASVRAHLDEDLVLPSTTPGGPGESNSAEISRKKRLESRTPTQSPTIKPSEVTGFPFKFSSKGQFECVFDSEELWQRRRSRVSNLTQQYCKGHVTKHHTGHVPVVIGVRPKPSDKRALQLLIYASNIAARFNDVVYILCFEAGPGWADLRSKFRTLLRPNVQLIVFDQNSDDPISAAFRSFASVYSHMSVNSHDYELYCFQRWFGISRFVELHNLTNVLVLDSDVLLFANATQQRDLCFGECSVAAPHPLGTFTSFWTQTYLTDFANYIFKWYATKQFNNGNHTQLSDMNFIKFFAESRGSDLPPQCISPANLGFIISNENRSDAAHSILRGMRSHTSPLDSRFQDEIGLPLLYFPSNLSVPVYMSTVHFQGSNKRKLNNCFVEI